MYGVHYMSLYWYCITAARTLCRGCNDVMHCLLQCRSSGNNRTSPDRTNHTRALPLGNECRTSTRTLINVLCTVYCVRRTVYTRTVRRLRRTLYVVHLKRTLYSLRCTLYTVYIVRGTINVIQCTQYIAVRNTLCTIIFNDKMFTAYVRYN